jgi:iron(III) transport system substrate-binding protein
VTTLAVRNLLFAFAALLFADLASGQGTLAMYCSSPDTGWCQGMATGFEKATGVKVTVTQKATGELFAQIKAEANNPKGDIWWAGPGDAFLQAAEEGLLETYKSANLDQLHGWARREAEASRYRVAGVYGGILALGYNTEVLERRKLPVPKCWRDLTNPVYKGEIMLSNPNSSGTAYMMVASLVQVMGEDEAFRYMMALNANVNQYARSGIGPMTAVTRGETGIGSTVLHGVINEVMRGFPVKAILPCEGVGYEVGSMAIIKGARNLDNAKKFFDWALTVEAQSIGLTVGEYAIPTNKNVKLPPQVPNLADIKLIDYNSAKYGSAAERKRLLERWEKEINAIAR